MSKRSLSAGAHGLRVYVFTVIGTRLRVVAGRKPEKAHWLNWEGP